MRRKKYIAKRISFLVAMFLSISCFFTIHVETNASVNNDATIYPETSDKFSELHKSTLDIPMIEIKYENPTKDQASKNIIIKTVVNGNQYEFQATGILEKIDDGTIGLYQGYMFPDASDQELQFLKMSPQGVLVSIYHVQCKEDNFFTMTIGEISENTNPVVKTFGEQTDKISAIIRESYDKALKEQEKYENIGIQSDNRATAVDAIIRYQNGGIIYGNNINLGVMSLYHANELKNQSSMTTLIKINTNTEGANEYATDYFNVSSDYEVSSLATRIGMTITSSKDELHVVLGSESPTSGQQTITIPIPYKTGDGVGTINRTFTMMSISTQISGGNFGTKNIAWAINHAYGLQGLDGNNSTRTGMAGNVSYQYEGNVTSPLIATLTAKGYITYTAYVENSRLGTITPYPFTTTTISRYSNVKILP